MHTTDIGPWQHDHVFASESVSPAERRTRWVVGLTLLMMIAELVAGVAFGSMALLADGWHMGTHAAALGISALAYAFARRHARDSRYSFGAGRVGSLAGFASGVVLAVIAVLILWQSLVRIASPVSIHFDEAIAVASLGLVVNLVSAFLLRSSPHHGHPNSLAHHHDHNLRGAYLHVLADALTSVLAIVALVAGKWLGWVWSDPLVGVAGSLLIARWSLGLLRDTGNVLLDAEVWPERVRAIREAIEARDDNRVADLHLWRAGPRHFAVILSIVSRMPREPDHYKRLLSGFSDIAHISVEVHRCTGEEMAT